MILVERSAWVAAPMDVVWNVVQRAEQLPEWLAGVRQAEVLSGEGFGRRQLVQGRARRPRGRGDRLSGADADRLARAGQGRRRPRRGPDRDLRAARPG